MASVSVCAGLAGNFQRPGPTSSDLAPELNGLGAGLSRDCPWAGLVQAWGLGLSWELMEDEWTERLAVRDLFLDLASGSCGGTSATCCWLQVSHKASSDSGGEECNGEVTGALSKARGIQEARGTPEIRCRSFGKTARQPERVAVRTCVPCLGPSGQRSDSCCSLHVTAVQMSHKALRLAEMRELA